MPILGNEYNRMELADAFGDLSTFIPFAAVVPQWGHIFNCQSYLDIILQLFYSSHMARPVETDIPDSFWKGVHEISIDL